MFDCSSYASELGSIPEKTPKSPQPLIGSAAYE